jgi:hypothetical protein
MSHRPFTMPAHSLPKNDDPDLCALRFLPLHRACRMDLHVVAQMPPFAQPVAGQRIRKATRSCSPSLDCPCCCQSDQQEDKRLRRVRTSHVGTLHPIPSHGCFGKVSSLPDFPMSYSVTRSVLIPRPAALGVLLCAMRPLRVWVSKEKISLRLRPRERARFLSSEPPQKARLRPWERGTSRRFAQECPE